MLILFFTTIFVSELIITFWIISIIRKFNKMTCEMNEKVLQIQPILPEKICLEKEMLKNIRLKTDKYGAYINEKKESYKQLITPQIITVIAAFLIKNDWKKFFMAIDIFLSIKRLLRG